MQLDKENIKKIRWLIAFAILLYLGVQNLGFHFTIRKATANLDDTVRQRRLTVVDVSDDRKVTYILHI